VSLSDDIVVSSSQGGISYVPLRLAEQRARETGTPQTLENRDGVFWGLVLPPVVDRGGGRQP
jgi:hypothetical protein